jgi:ParB family chromosome partitioning protein
MSKVTNLSYFGDIRDLIADGKQIAFVTEHVEGFATSLFLIDGELNKLESVELPSGGLSLARMGDSFWIGGTDGLLYIADGKTAKAQKTKLPAPAKKIVRISDDEIACLCGSDVCLVDGKGKLKQTLSLESDGQTVEATAIGGNQDSKWLAVGSVDGTVFVFQREDADEFVLSESSKIHQGEVTSILFEVEELRFFSAGVDQKLLLTHARGALEPEDRGRANNHKERVTAMVLAGEKRFITGSLDRSCKSWARAGATKPSTLSDGLVAVTQLAVATIHKRSMLVATQSDNSIRLFLIDEDGKFGSASARYNDLFQRAAQLFDSNSTADRGKGLHELAALDDLASVELIARRIEVEKDVKLQQTAAKLLCESKHPRHQELLLPALSSSVDQVRKTVFEYLSESQTSDQDLLDFCSKAIETGISDIACDSVKIAERLASDKKNSDAFKNRAKDLIVKTFDHKVDPIRRAAVLAFESVFDKKSARPNLIALQSRQSDARRMGLIRIFQRKLLDDAEAAAGIRQKIEDPNGDVRRTAALLLILSRKKLAVAIRERDPNIDRQLMDLENFTIDSAPSTKTRSNTKKVKTEKTESESKKEKPTKKKVAKLPKPKLADADFQPLLIAVSARAVSTCLLGTKCLALLEDPRAFGLLMQLSREEDAAVRVEVCKALAALGDSRANERLSTLLADETVEVRDAAYSALTAIQSDDPLAAATDGLAASAEDVRRRGLETLVKHARKTKPKSIDDPAIQLLLQALNDEANPIRNEAFKFILNSKIGGGEEKSLRLILNSVHADVRREVLTETMALSKESWARELLLDLLDDPDKEIRTDTFSHLEKEAKDTDLSWLEDAIVREHEDVRMAACIKLVKNRTNESRKVLLKAIDDDEESIRFVVIKSLVDANSVDQLRAALDSKKVDVRLGAAFALAQLGDPAARDVLVDVAEQPKPTVASFKASWDELTAGNDEERDLAQFEALQKNWQSNVITANMGLSRLGDPTTLDCVLANLKNEEEAVRKSAAWALAWVSNEDSLDKVRPFMRHSDEPVKSYAAFAMVMANDPIGLPQVFSKEAASIESVQRLVAAVVLGDRTEGRLLQMLEADSSAIRNAALIVMLSRDYLLHDGSPRLTTACLAARDPRIRLLAAKAIESFADTKSFLMVIESTFNDRSESKDWTVETETIEKIAAVICFGSNQLVARLIWFLPKLDQEKPNDWNDEWRAYSERFANEIAAAAKQAKPPKVSTDSDSLNQLAFGTYVGLAREQGSYHQRGEKPGFGATVISVRATAINRLVAISQNEKSFHESTISVLTQTAGDPNQLVRQLAFDELKTLDVGDEQRAAIAIETGHRDLAVAGLTLLTSSGKKATQIELLTNVILTRNDEIALEAANLLKNLMDEVKVAEICFDSPYMQLPVIATSWLSASFDSSDAAKKVIRSLAMESENQNVRFRAVRTLVSAKDKQAFDALCKAARLDDEKIRTRYIQMFSLLGDPRSGDFLLDELESNQQLDGKAYFSQMAVARDPQVAERLLNCFEEWTQWRDLIFNALLRISGYDQRIMDPNDLLPDQSHLNRQFPRHDKELAGLLEATNRFGTIAQLKKLIPGARWSKGSEVDAPLASLAIHADDGIRLNAVEAIGFRGEKRSMEIDVLSSALKNRDPNTKLFAAEGLAKSGNAEGIQVLLTAVELMDDLRLRKRAVLALGYLADERAYDVLIRLATDSGHALQDSAAEAIGRLRESKNRSKIVETLLQLVAGGGSAAHRALIGLRWLDAPEG